MRNTIVIHFFTMALVIAGCGTVREAEAPPFPPTCYTLVITLAEAGSGVGDVTSVVAGTALIRSLQVTGTRLQQLTISYTVYNDNEHAKIAVQLRQLPGIRIIYEHKQ